MGSLSQLTSMIGLVVFYRVPAFPEIMEGSPMPAR
jgi:hypothetical protein